jgi:hypothetical protein
MPILKHIKLKGKQQRKTYTWSYEQKKRLDRPKAKRNAFPMKGSLSSAFKSISLIRVGSFIDTKS